MYIYMYVVMCVHVRACMYVRAHVMCMRLCMYMRMGSHLASSFLTLPHHQK